MGNSLISFIVALFSTAALAITLDTPLPDAAQEAQARVIFEELRCVVCEGQSLAESNAALAVQMRVHVREMVHAGKREPEILAFFRERYGDTILMQPPVTVRTVALWLSPFAFLMLGGWFLWKRTGREV